MGRDRPNLRDNAPPSAPAPPLAAIRAGGYGLRGCCNACQHADTLDLAALIERLGPDFVGVDLNGRLRCTRCGSRRTAIQIYPLRNEPGR